LKIERCTPHESGFPVLAKETTLKVRAAVGAWVALIGVSAALSWLLERAAFPAALLLGPMLAAMAFGARGTTLRVPRWAFAGAQAFIGCLVARAVTAPIIASIAHAWVLMLAVVTTTILAGAVVGFALARWRVLPGTTAAWGSSPGGASAMIAMSAEFGADPRLVALMQYTRVIVVVLTASIVSRLLLGTSHAAPPVSPRADLWALPPALPFAQTLCLAGGGAWIAQRLKIPAGNLLVPMTIGAILHATGLLAIELPTWLLGAAYTALGWYVGLQFTRDTVAAAIRSIPALLTATFLLIGLCALSAWLLRAFSGTDALTAYLATSPGGLDSIAIIAVGSGANIPFVLAIQALRIFVVILTGPPLAKLISRYA
jgi:membrane AbrB-like protein